MPYQPHHDLKVIQEYIKKNSLEMTQDAMRGVSTLGYQEDEVVAAIMTLKEGYLFETVCCCNQRSLYMDRYLYRDGKISIYIGLRLSGALKQKAYVCQFEER